MTDYKRLCNELLSYLYQCNWPDAKRFYVLVERARAALAEPEPELPTDDEVEVLADQLGLIRGHANDPCGFWISDGDAGALVRAALARWGRPS